jgi:hypothetical protein
MGIRAASRRKMAGIYSLLLLSSFGSGLTKAIESPFGFTAGEFGRAAKSCESFVQAEMGKLVELDTRIIDSYAVRGNIVVEIGYRDPRSEMANRGSYYTRVCVSDQKKRELYLPSLQDEPNWRQ